MQGRTEQQKERQGVELRRREDGEEMREGRERRRKGVMKNEPHWEIRGGLTLLVMKGGCDGRMEGGREGEIINELALPVTPS